MGYRETDPQIVRLSELAAADIKPRLREIDRVSLENTRRVLAAFQKHRVSDACFAGTTGYGYGDRGRDTLDLVYADVCGAQAALVRAGFVSGTHALTAALFAPVRAGDVLLSATGAPYDTLRGVIGMEGDHRGSLKDFGVGYAQAELLPDGKPDLDTIVKHASDERVAAVFVQRSRGYSDRPALSVAGIGEICDAVHHANPRAAVVVDNCYGEFVENREPTSAGASDRRLAYQEPNARPRPDGRLRPGRPTSTRRGLPAHRAGHRRGMRGDAGYKPAFVPGFFLRRHTAQALKTAVFCARLLELMGFESSPAWDEERSDIIQAVAFRDPDLLRRFCEGIQAGAPVDAFVRPEPWDMPGYGCPVVMAAGTFVQGASVELTADGPMRPPYTAYLQGGLTYEAGRLGVMTAANMLLYK
jgi:cystathionine beta-lyase family protein involved in aluminum resistance